MSRVTPVRTTIVVAALALAGLLPACAGAAARAATPHLLSCTDKPLTRPRGEVIFACADANTLIKSTRWTSWTVRSARGVTDFGLNFCKPYCAASRVSFFPHSHIRLEAVRRTRYGLLFTEAVVTYRLHGALKTAKIPLVV